MKKHILKKNATPATFLKQTTKRKEKQFSLCTKYVIGQNDLLKNSFICSTRLRRLRKPRLQCTSFRFLRAYVWFFSQYTQQHFDGVYSFNGFISSLLIFYNMMGFMFLSFIFIFSFIFSRFMVALV